MKVSFCSAAAALLVAVSSVSAGVSSQWNFNIPTTNGTSSVFIPSVGAGTFTYYGRATSFLLPPFSTAASNGSPADPGTLSLAPGQQNHSMAVNAAVVSVAAGTTASPTIPSGSRGVQVSASTSGLYGVSVRWNFSAGFRTSRYYQLYLTSDGTNYLPASGGTGSIAGNLGTFTPSGGSPTTAATSATVSDTGLVDIRYRSGVIASTAAQITSSFVYDLSYSLPFGTAYENNPNFGFRIAPVFDATAADYVSSFAGTASTDATAGYLSGTTASGGGTINYDLVTVAGVPEPTGALTTVAAGGLAVLRRRRTA